ncbi:MAG: hypothetical protein AMJ92_08120 [candidate division Zixibacteria bacterium SM23_81]|nr:MAG: hypothetical protein AMJ92_08120 [candidate division Zixibacteria bacterium SM23_81]
MIPRKRIRVHTYSGYRADERPVSFGWGQKKILIKRVLRQWIEERVPAGGERKTRFLVEGLDGETYQLCYHHQEGIWILEDNP